MSIFQNIPSNWNEIYSPVWWVEESGSFCAAKMYNGSEIREKKSGEGFHHSKSFLG